MITKLIRPVAEPHTVTSGYGERTINGQTQFHPGIDYANGDSPANYHKDKRVFAICDGVVTFDWDNYDPRYKWDFNSPNSGGEMVLINHEIHGVTYEVGYLHLTENYVTKGQKVKRGDVIGIYGDHGAATGPHVHFPMKLNGQFVDPTPIMLKGLSA